MSIVYGKGINDMPRGWASEDEWNKMVYLKWKNMLARCYSEKYHEKHPTYKDCTVCERWLLLSNFVEDFYKIDGYDKEKLLNGELCLDKDIKSNGQNKEYYIENCMLVSNTENIKQSNKTMDYSFIKTGENSRMYGKIGEDHPCSIKVVQYDKQGNLIKVWDCISDVERKLGIKQCNISTCCSFWKMNCNKEEWFKTYKAYPLKSAGGFIWKYYDENK